MRGRSKGASLTGRVALRLPAGQLDDWKQRAEAADLDLGPWIRRCVDADNSEPAKPKPRRRRRLRTLTADPELLRQLAAVGSNVNQIARVLNSIGMSSGDHVYLLAELAAIQRELHRLAELPRYDPDVQGKEA